MSSRTKFKLCEKTRERGGMIESRGRRKLRAIAI